MTTDFINFLYNCLKNKKSLIIFNYQIVMTVVFEKCTYYVYLFCITFHTSSFI